MSTLAKMTQARWNALSPAEREAIRDYSELTPQLVGLEGWRVEVTTNYGETRRFIVSRSLGWRPIHLEMHNRRSSSGIGAKHSYVTVRKLYNTKA